MQITESKQIINLGLILLSIFFAVLLVLELNSEHDLSEQHYSHSVKQAEVKTEEIKPIKLLAEYVEITERPLFNSDRKPIVAAASKVVKQEVKVKKAMQRSAPPQLQLKAIVLTPEKNTAIIQINNDEEPLHLTEGEIFQGWTLTKIENQYVEFKNNDQIQNYELEIDK